MANIKTRLVGIVRVAIRDQSLLVNTIRRVNGSRGLHWLSPQYHDQEKTKIKKPDELEREMTDPPESVDESLLTRIRGSMLGMALGDALGAPVEFRPPEYLLVYPVKDLQDGGTWGLKKGQVRMRNRVKIIRLRVDFILHSSVTILPWPCVSPVL